MEKKLAVAPEKILSGCLYAVIMVCAAVYSAKRPACNWDMLPYMGVVLHYQQADATAIHKEVYGAASAQLPAEYFRRMTAADHVYRNSAAKDPFFFQAQLPFYLVKPLYTGMAVLFYRAGASLTMATVWPSIASYLLMGLLLFYWLQKYWPGIYGCVASALLMLSPPLLTVAGLSSPDALSGLLLLSAVFCMAEKRSFTGTAFFLLLAVLARLDNIIPALFFLPVFFVPLNGNAPLPLTVAGVYLVMVLLVFLAVSGNVTAFGWSRWFYPSFVKQLNTAYTPGDSFSWHNYLQLARVQLQNGFYFSYLSYFMLLVLLLAANAREYYPGRLTEELLICLLFILVMALRFILQPLVADRLYIPYYLAAAVLLVKRNGWMMYNKAL